MSKLTKPLDRLPFLLAAIPFLLAGYDAVQLNDWGIATASLVLGTLNLLTAILGSRFPVSVNTAILLLNVLMATTVAYYFYAANTEGLPYFWLIITAGYFLVLIMYRLNIAKAVSQDSAPAESKD